MSEEKILVIEDEEDIANLVKLLLRAKVLRSQLVTVGKRD